MQGKRRTKNEEKKAKNRKFLHILEIFEHIKPTIEKTF